MTDKPKSEPYKGVRDFYPEDEAIENYIFDTWRLASKYYGYEEYNASILEPSELYKVKTNEEIVSNQTYTFKDRGDREVTLRPEMTPTVARMVASKRRELVFPLRWFSIANVFRYERPQRGRLREHWQLNADIFGESGLSAEVEIISFSSELLKVFGLREKDFEIKINSRKLSNIVFADFLGLDEEARGKASNLVDRKDKMEGKEFETEAKKLLNDKAGIFMDFVNAKDLGAVKKLLGNKAETEIAEIETLLARLKTIGVGNAKFDQTIVRGFDYYTGIVFEVFDTNKENNRSLFGGGRYDNLLENFGDEKIPAIGFGMGDVTLRDALETRGLLPKPKSSAKVALCTIDEAVIPFTEKLATELRTNGIMVLVDASGKKIGDKIKNANKRMIPFTVAIGDEEVKTNKFKLKNLANEKETNVSLKELIDSLKN